MDLHFLYTGHIQSEAGWRIDAHQHSFYEIIVVVHGTEEVLLENEPLRVPSGCALLCPPNTFHEEWAHGGGALETFFMAFRCESVPTDLPLQLTDTRGRMGELATWIYQERDAYLPEAVAARAAYCESLFLEYLRLAGDRGHDLVDAVRGHIRAHLAETVTLDDLARAAGLSKFHFLRAYRRLTGLTPMQDLRRIRLETARHFLLSGRLPLKAIAPRVGLANEYHLSRLFREQYGMSAREIRLNRF